jgi:hypothetical protein
VASFDAEKRDDDNPMPRVVKMTSRYYGDSMLLAAADFIQQALPVTIRPKLDESLAAQESVADDDEGDE